MKKIVVTNFSEYGDQKPTKNALVIMGEEEMDAHDGYHSFTELYDHRITLYVVLCRVFQYLQFLELASNPYTPVKKVWKSKKHSDGSEMEGWFILGIGEEKGKQLTYHIPESRWEELPFAEVLEKAPEWDGHTSEDVLNRLKTL